MIKSTARNVCLQHKILIAWPHGYARYVKEYAIGDASMCLLNA